MLSALGLTPQVITEALYALYYEGKQVSRVVVITTKEGKNRIVAKLLCEGTGEFYRLLDTYGISRNSIRFDIGDIHVVKDELGKELDDIMSEDDNERFLAKCFELTYEFTSNKNALVYFLVAGGRKTMTSCLTFAAQIYGRVQDRMYHVLVSQEFEGSEEFYFPPLEDRDIEIKDKNGHPVIKNTKFAQVHLIPIPFVSIRESLDPKLLKKPQKPEVILQELVRTESKKLVVDLDGMFLSYSNRQCDLRPSHMAVYLYFALKRMRCQCQHPEKCKNCFIGSEIFNTEARMIGDIYQIISRSPERLRSRTGLRDLDPTNFNSIKSHINSAIKKAFGAIAHRSLAISSTGKRGSSKWGIKVRDIVMEGERSNAILSFGNVAEYRN